MIGARDDTDRVSPRTGLPHRRRHQRTFLAAGIYNIAWGVFSAIDPQWLFRFARMRPDTHPQIFVTLAMVIGLYGILYLEVARAPEAGWVIAAVGFAGKVLGPLGLAVLLVSRQWPLASSMICLTNDVVWWIPFALYLKEAWPTFTRSLATDRERYHVQVARPRVSSVSAGMSDQTKERVA